MLKQKVTTARQWSLRLICGTVLGLLVTWIVAPRPGATQELAQAKTQPDTTPVATQLKSGWFRGDLSLRGALGNSQLQAIEPVVITTVDPSAVSGATFQSHNQKVVANAHGIFMTHIHQQHCCDRSLRFCCDLDDPLCYDAEAGRCRGAGRDVISTWRLSRSVDGGKTFTTVYEGRHGTNPPALETDSQGNIYLAHINNFQGGQNAYVWRFLASNNFRNPTSTTLRGASGAKFAMEIDEARGQLYYFSNSNKFFRIRLSDLAILAQYQLTRNGTNANMHYPHLYLDDYGHLYLAWTTARINPKLKDSCGNEANYRSIHFMRSLDGGRSWYKPNGTLLYPIRGPFRVPFPIVADDTGPTDRISEDDELCDDNWLSTFLVKGDKAHFVYRAYLLDRQHYVRYDLATAQIDRNVVPFSGDSITVSHDDGVCATGRSIKEIFCVSKYRPDNKIAVLKSEDNGLTWRDHELSPAPEPTAALGGSPQVTDDGYIIGSYTGAAPYPVKFFKVASRAEPSRKDLVFTAGDLELTGSAQDYDEFSGASTAHSPAYVVGQSGLDRIRHYIGYSYDDPNGGNKAQFLRFNNLVVGKQYTFYVQTSAIGGDGNCFNATAGRGAVIFEGACKGWPGNPINRTRDAWKVVFNATEPLATIRLGNFFDASNSGGVSRFIYIDAIYSMIGDLELSGNARIDTDELTGAAREHSPTYVFGERDPSYLRHYIGFSYSDPVGGNKAQYLQLTNLIPGRNYTLDVYPSGNYGDGNCYYAEANSGGTVVTGGCKGWNTTGQFQSVANRWRIVVRAQSHTMRLRIGNYWDANNSGGVSRFIYLDAIGLRAY